MGPVDQVTPLLNALGSHRRISRADARASAFLLLLALLSFSNGLFDPLTTIQEDIALQWEGLHAAANEQIRSGHFPHWNFYSLGGERLFANIMLALFYPGSLLFRIAPFPTACLWTLIIHYWALALATYAFGRIAVGLSPTAATVAAAIFAFGGYSIGHCNHLNFVFALPWMPVLLIATHKLCVPQKNTTTRRWLLAGTVALTFMLLSGGLPVIAITEVALIWLIVANCCWNTQRPSKRRAFVACGWTIGMHVAAIGLAAVQLLPTLDLYGRSERAMWSKTTLLEGGMPWRTLAYQLIAPGVLDDQFSGLGNWAGVGHETFVFTGGVGLALAAIGVSGVRRHRWVLPLVILAGLATILCVRNSPVLALLKPLMFLNVRAPSRFVGLLQFSLAFLAGVGLDHRLFERRRPGLRTELICVGVSLATVTCTSVFAFWISSIPADPTGAADWLSHQSIGVRGWLGSVQPGQLAHVWSQPTSSAVCLVVISCCGGFIAWGCGWLKVRHPRLAVATLLLACTVELRLFTSGTWAGQERFPGVTRQPTPIVDYLKNNLGNDRYANFAVYMPLWENRGAIHCLANSLGYVGTRLNVRTERGQVLNALHGGTLEQKLFSVKYLLLREGVDPGPARVVFQDEGIVVCECPDRLSRAVLVPDAVIMKSTQDAIEGMKAKCFDPRDRVFISDSTGTASVSSPAALRPDESAIIDKWDAGHIRVRYSSQVDRCALIGTSYDEGWKCCVEGSRVPLLRADACLLAARVPAGKHVMELTYRTPGLIPGLVISLIALVLSALSFCKLGADSRATRGRHTENAPEELV